MRLLVESASDSKIDPLLRFCKISAEDYCLLITKSHFAQSKRNFRQLQDILLILSENNVRCLKRLEKVLKVEVYRNLRKKCYSVRRRGIVIAHSNNIIITDATFVVQPAGRQKVLNTKQKNVHAVVRGVMVGFFQKEHLSECVDVSYDPYRFDYFYIKDSLEPIYESDFVIFNDGGVKAWTQKNCNLSSTMV